MPLINPPEPPNLSPYAKMGDLGTLLQIYTGTQDPRTIQSLTVNPGFTWIEVDPSGAPVMTWQYTILSGVGMWVSTYLDRLGGLAGGLSGTTNIFSGDDYALPYNLLPCYVSIKAQNQTIARPGGIGGTTNSTLNYWDLSLRVYPDQTPVIEVAQFTTKDLDWPETGLNLYVQLPCTPYILNTAGLGGTKNPRTFVLRCTKTGAGNVNLIQFVWSMTYRYIRR